MEELEELLQLANLDAVKARAIYEAGFTSIYHVSKARSVDIMKALQKTLIS
jgi:replicative superfamily II helicase